MKHKLYISFTIMFFLISLIHADVVRSYDDMNECTTFSPSTDVQNYNMCKVGGIDLNYQFGIKFIKYDSKPSPNVIIFFQASTDEAYSSYTDYIKIKTKSGKLYTLKVDGQYKTSFVTLRTYCSYAIISADDYVKCFLYDIPVKIQVSLNQNTLQLNVGPRQINGLTQMANFYMKAFKLPGKQ